MFRSLTNRSTGEVLVVMIAGTICILVLFSALAVAVLELIDFTIDTTAAVAVISDVTNTLIGLMAGFLAGRTENAQRKNAGPNNE